MSALRLRADMPAATSISENCHPDLRGTPWTYDGPHGQLHVDRPPKHHCSCIFFGVVAFAILAD